jgi:hypothetical protein
MKDYSNITLKLAEYWSLDELRILRSALEQILKAFNGKMDVFKQEFGDVTIYRLPWVDIFGATGMTPPGMQAIFLSDSVFNSGEIFAQYSIIHEFGHIFDFHDSYGNFYWSESWAIKYAPSCHSGWLGCIGVKTNYPQFLWGGADNKYNPNANSVYTTDYGANSSVDDFADSFAAVVMGGNFPYRGFGSDSERLQWIKDLITDLTNP